MSNISTDIDKLLTYGLEQKHSRQSMKRGISALPLKKQAKTQFDAACNPFSAFQSSLIPANNLQGHYKQQYNVMKILLLFSLIKQLLCYCVLSM